MSIYEIKNPIVRRAAIVVAAPLAYSLLLGICVVQAVKEGVGEFSYQWRQDDIWNAIKLCWAGRPD